MTSLKRKEKEKTTDLLSQKQERMDNMAREVLGKEMAFRQEKSNLYNRHGPAAVLPRLVHRLLGRHPAAAHLRAALAAALHPRPAHGLPQAPDLELRRVHPGAVALRGR